MRLYLYDVAGREHTIAMAPGQENAKSSTVGSIEVLPIEDSAGKKHLINLNNIVRWVVK